MQARGLRQARSGLVGMIIPIHDNRFFSSLSQSFDTLARERGQCPVIASTLRNPREERRIVETLISYAVDALFIAGATEPEQLGELCAAANLRHIFIDLPGKNAPSVVTDNFSGAQKLTERILAAMPPPRGMHALFPGRFGQRSRHGAPCRGVVAVAGRGRGIGRPDHPVRLRAAKCAAAIAELCLRIGGLPPGCSSILSRPSRA